MKKIFGKKSIALLLAMMLVFTSFAAAGCGSGSDTEKTEEDANASQVFSLIDDSMYMVINAADEQKADDLEKEINWQSDSEKKDSDKDKTSSSSKTDSTKKTTTSTTKKTTTATKKTTTSSSKKTSTSTSTTKKPSTSTSTSTKPASSTTNTNTNTNTSGNGGTSTSGNSNTPADTTLTCTVSISCSTVFNNKDKCSQSVLDLQPADGKILDSVTVEFKEGESVFDVLQTVCKSKDIQFEHETTPAYNTVYIKGINNLYEFDCGELSGWLYSVNGEFPNYGCSEYKVKKGDQICWIYTCDLGKDVGKDVDNDKK